MAAVAQSSSPALLVLFCCLSRAACARKVRPPARAQVSCVWHEQAHMWKVGHTCALQLCPRRARRWRCLGTPPRQAPAGASNTAARVYGGVLARPARLNSPCVAARTHLYRRWLHALVAARTCTVGAPQALFALRDSLLCCQGTQLGAALPPWRMRLADMGAVKRSTILTLAPTPPPAFLFWPTLSQSFRIRHVCHGAPADCCACRALCVGL